MAALSGAEAIRARVEQTLVAERVDLTSEQPAASAPPA